MGFRLAAFIAGASGFIALSYEILWYRLYSFVSWGVPRAFGILLAAYLLGIAVGSFGVRRYCDDEEAARTVGQLRLARILFVAGVVCYFVGPILAYTATISHLLFAIAAVSVATALLGAVLPLLSHLAIAPDDRAGARLSYIYLANIFGSTAGSILTGFVAMDHWSTRTIALGLGLLSLALAGLVLFFSDIRSIKLVSHVVELGVAAVGMTALSHPLFDQLYERLLYKERFTRDVWFVESIENRSGVVSLTSDGRVWGGGAYDGAINTSISSDQNLILRAYAVSALHPNPAHMLMIGLASGSWAEVLANAPGLESFLIVEINPGYLDLISHHPEVSAVLTNPKVKIVIDDGRRWLLAHPDAKFDTIVMNTSWHWRAHSSDLLSKEFLELARIHMNPGGLLFYNTTSSHDVWKTALTVFPYVLRVVNFAAVSDSPLALDKSVWKKVLTSYRLDGVTVLDPAKKEDENTLNRLLAFADSIDEPPRDYGIESRESLASRMSDGTVITDDNMACEWREYFPDEF
jgi:spermidine synthase